MMKLSWRLTHLCQPSVDPLFPKMGCLDRTAESLRYCLLKTEHWLSPRGFLREWLRNNSTVAILLGIPALLVMPVLLLLFTQIVSFTGMLMMIAKNIAMALMAMLAALVALAILRRVVWA